MRKMMNKKGLVVLMSLMTLLFFVVMEAVMAKEEQEIPDEINKGKFNTLLGWLQSNIYKLGSKYTASELIERVTGDSLRVEPYIKYLKTKYCELYNL